MGYLENGTHDGQANGVDHAVLAALEALDVDRGPQEPSLEAPPSVSPTAPPAAQPAPDRGWSGAGAAAAVETTTDFEQCVIIGPSGAGKTCTLSALDPSCYGGALDNGCRLSVINDPTVDKHGLLSRYVVDWVALDRPPPATSSRREFQIEVAAHRPGRWFRASRTTVTSIRCTDGPGGTLFPSRQDMDAGRIDAATQQELIHQAQSAASIVLVVDCAAPATDLVELHLRSVLDRSASLRDVEPHRPFVVRLLDRLGLHRDRGAGGPGRPADPPRGRAARRSQLRARRFLVLLTKVDAFAHEVSGRLVARGVQASPRAVAAALDPIALARELVGERNLRRIRGALADDATMAVGLSSVTGFVHDAGGRTFLEWAAGRSPAERLVAWTSFGVYEALRFIATGECLGPVRAVSSEHELVQERALAIDSFPFAR